MTQIFESTPVDRELITALSRARRLWGVVDGCADAELAAELFAARGAGVISLFEGTSAVDFRAVAPYLVQLDRSWLAGLESRWEAPWGILFESGADAAVLAPHLRSLLDAEMPDGERLYFRFYDPRVFRPFLMASNATELVRLFGPVEAFGWARRDRSAVLATPVASVRAVVPQGPTPTSVLVRPAHLQAFQRAAEAQFEAKLAAHLHSHFPERVAPLGKTLATRIQAMIATARRNGLATEKEMAQYVTAVVGAGSSGPATSPPAWAEPILTDQGSQPSAKAERLARVAERRIEAGLDA